MRHPASVIQRAERIVSRCREIAVFTEVPGETTRTFLAPSMHGVHALLRAWMEAAGMTVKIDAIGNLRAVFPASSSAEDLPRLIVGSHLDTVPNAGAFDGVLGVVLGIAVVEELRDTPLAMAIEIVGFSEEEGVRFAKPFLGSLAFIGEFGPETLECADADGISIAQAVRDFGIDDAEICKARVSEEAVAYLEVHIEQGPVLDSEGRSLGVVRAIVGQTRMQFHFIGQSNHAGTTPMHLRRDAMAAAAAWITAVETYAQATPGLVATVGKVAAMPGAGNVIAGEVVASLDVRHDEDSVREAAVSEMVDLAMRYGDARGVKVFTRSILQQKMVATDPALTRLLGDAAANAGIEAKQMVSGAGHDVMIVARKLPAALLFVRSPGGLSHHPDESVLTQDIAAALATSIEFVRLFAKQFQKEAHV